MSLPSAPVLGQAGERQIIGESMTGTPAKLTEQNPATADQDQGTSSVQARAVELHPARQHARRGRMVTPAPGAAAGLGRHIRRCSDEPAARPRPGVHGLPAVTHDHPAGRARPPGPGDGVLGAQRRSGPRSGAARPSARGSCSRSSAAAPAAASPSASPPRRHPSSSTSSGAARC